METIRKKITKKTKISFYRKNVYLCHIKPIKKHTKMAEELDNNQITILTLTDEAGKDTDFEVVDTLEYEGDTYYALQEYIENVADLDKRGEDEDVEILILKRIIENGEEVFDSIADDELFDKLTAMFDARMDEESDDAE